MHITAIKSKFSLFSVTFVFVHKLNGENSVPNKNVNKPSGVLKEINNSAFLIEFTELSNQNESRKY